VTIPDEHVPYILTAVEHYAAYMKATARDERPYSEIAELLKRKGQREIGYEARPELNETVRKQ